MEAARKGNRTIGRTIEISITLHAQSLYVPSASSVVIRHISVGIRTKA